MELVTITECIQSSNSNSLAKSNISAYRYGLHPIFKLSILILLNILAFLPEIKDYRPILLWIELILAVLVKLHIFEISGFFKFLIWNFLGLYILFYFVEYDFWKATIYFYEYSLSILIMFLGTFIFTKATPPRELLIALLILRIPRGLALGITIALTFLPTLTANFRQILAFQQARGYKFRVYRLSPVLIPGLLMLLDLSTNLAISLEARGFQIK